MLQNFDAISDACLKSVEETEERYEELVGMFDKYKNVAEILFKPSTYMKSQKKLVPEIMDAPVLDFILVAHTQ